MAMIQNETAYRAAMERIEELLPLVGDEALAEDLVHDTFILILEHIGELRDASRLEPWMSLTLRRVALQYLRSWYARHISFPGELHQFTGKVNSGSYGYGMRQTNGQTSPPNV